VTVAAIGATELISISYLPMRNLAVLGLKSRREPVFAPIAHSWV
jgi:hypothetical protein